MRQAVNELRLFGDLPEPKRAVARSGRETSLAQVRRQCGDGILVAEKCFDIGPGVGIPDLDGPVKASAVELRRATTEGQTRDRVTVLVEGMKQLVFFSGGGDGMDFDVRRFGTRGLSTRERQLPP